MVRFDGLSFKGAARIRTSSQRNDVVNGFDQILPLQFCIICIMLRTASARYEFGFSIFYLVVCRKKFVCDKAQIVFRQSTTKAFSTRSYHIIDNNGNLEFRPIPGTLTQILITAQMTSGSLTLTPTVSDLTGFVYGGDVASPASSNIRIKVSRLIEKFMKQKQNLKRLLGC